MNESIFLFLCICTMTIQSDYVLDAVIKYKYGYCFLSLLGAILSINALVLIKDVIVDVFKKLISTANKKWNMIIKTELRKQKIK